MSMKYLGPTLDIHGGGLDLQFPHHENELAQSESYTGQPFVRYWMHNGLMKMGHTKMAGSVGNVINVVDLLRQHPPETVRFLLLGTHYRSPIEYSEDRLQEVRRSLEGFYRFFERYRRVTGKSFYELEAPTKQGPFDIGTAPNEFVAEVARLRAAFLENMADDFNTGGAIGLLYELLTALNRFADARQLEGPRRETGAVGDFERGAVVLRELSQILGLFREPPPTSGAVPAQLLRGLEELARELNLVEGGGPEQSAGAAQPREQLDALLRVFIRRRAEARKARDFALADQIRQRLGQLGVTLEDRREGTDWRLS
jgi:cysteinyl-tRNA synthetase